MDLDRNYSPEEANPAKRTAKLRRSCETCRGSKARCLPSEDDPARCQKCLKDGKPCIFLEAKPRPKRARNSRLRVAEMEEKLEGLLNLLAAQATKGSSTSQPDTPAPSTTPSSSSTRDPMDPSLFLDGPNDLISASDFVYPPTSSAGWETFNPNSQLATFPFSSFDRIQDVVSKGVVSFAQAEEALRRFQAQCAPFPFVNVDGMSLDALRRHRPFLLLAILAMGTEPNAALQQKIEKELREALSKRLIIECERSLDLLEGLLVYLAWYHFYFNSEKQQLYQLSQMATSMAVDLGLNKPLVISSVPTSIGVVLASQLMGNTCLPNNTVDDSEAKRAFLGCYYLSSSICHALRMPNNLKYTDYVEECAKSLAEAGQNDSDRLLIYFIQLERLAEEVNQTFDYASSFRSTPSDAIRVGVLAKQFEQQLNHIENSYSTDAWNNGTAYPNIAAVDRLTVCKAQLAMHIHMARIHLTEIGFHAQPAPDFESLSPQLKARSWYHSDARGETLLRCLQACKDYLDRFISIPGEVVMGGTLPDILSLIYAVLVLGAFATTCDCPTLDPLQVREMANFEYYLNNLINNLGRAIGSRPPGSNEYLHHVYALFEQTKLWYAQILLDPSAEGFSNVGRPGFSFMDILPTIMNRCMDFAAAASCNTSLVTTTASDTSAPTDEQWGELLSNWSGSLDPTMSVEPLEQFRA